MNRTHISLLSMGVVAAALFALVPTAAAQDDDFPPPEVIATLSPVYFEGHAAYWYHDHWHYRDAHGAWGFYHDEPGFLRDRRVARPVDRHYYTTGHPAFHPASMPRRR